MGNVVHKIYHLTFPCGKDYIGSTCQKLNERYGGYRNDYKKYPNNPVNKVSIQYSFNEVRMVEIDRIKCIKYDPKVKMLEEEWKLKLQPILNVYKAYQTNESKKKERKERAQLEKGKLRDAVYTAKQNIKRYTKQNRPDMVLKWEGILEERIQNRLDHQSS